MVPVVIQTDNRLSEIDRFAQYRQFVAGQIVPVELGIDQLEGFSAQFTVHDVGTVNLITLTTHTSVPCLGERTRRLIRRSDPEAYRLIVNLSGDSRATHLEQDVALGPGDLALYDTSIPFQVWRGARGGGPGNSIWVMATFPHALLPLRPQVVRRLLGGRLCGHTGIGALISQLVQQNMHKTGLGHLSIPFHLSTALVDLLAALVVEELGEPAMLPSESARRGLLLRAQSFIEHHLGDPDLSPDTVAAAHHISTRSLHRLFNDHGLMVAGWIRTRRLDRCQRDLINPSLKGQSIRTIAARWGFHDQAHFSRLFRSTYGISATEYRQRCIETPAS